MTAFQRHSSLYLSSISVEEGGVGYDDGGGDDVLDYEKVEEK